jgi:basic membrane protein A
MYKNLAAAFAAACCFLPFHFQAAQAAEPLKVGFVYVTPVSDAGWVHQHEEGRKAVDAAFGARVKTTYVENVAEGPDAERVIRDLAASGHKLIFTPSFGYMEPTLKVAKDFPTSGSSPSPATRPRPMWRRPTPGITRAATWPAWRRGG